MEALRIENNERSVKYLTLDELKSQCGSDVINIRTSKKTYETEDGKEYHLCFFVCNGVTGYVSKGLGQKLQDKEKIGTVSASYSESTDFQGFMLYEDSTESLLATL